LNSERRKGFKKYQWHDLKLKILIKWTEWYFWFWSESSSLTLNFKLKMFQKTKLENWQSRDISLELEIFKKWETRNFMAIWVNKSFQETSFFGIFAKLRCGLSESVSFFSKVKPLFLHQALNKNLFLFFCFYSSKNLLKLSFFSKSFRLYLSFAFNYSNKTLWRLLSKFLRS